MLIDDSFIYNLKSDERKIIAQIITVPEVLARLANDNNSIVRCHVAWNRNTPPEALDRLVNDDDDWVRFRVAQNPNTSTETLERLANDRSSSVRANAACNPNYKKPNTIQFTNDQMVALKSLIESASNPHLQEFLKNVD
jgi:hypothetical protein